MQSINKIAQVFPEDLLKEVSTVIDTVPWKYGWASNKDIEFTHWNYSFAKGGALNGLDISKELTGPIAKAWQHIQTNITGPQALLRCYTNAHTFGVEGYPHTDSKRDADQTIVVYMTKHWQRDWGGETTIYDGDNIVHAELPKYNAGLAFYGNQWHCARSVSRICPSQRITLMFKFAPIDCDVTRDKIQSFLALIGADTVKHSGRNLWTHLLNVYDILKAQGYKQSICSAGGLHSIFGTTIFTKQMLTKEQRPIVVNLIGEEATQLVELFSTMKRPNTLEAALKNNVFDVEMKDGSVRTLSQIELNSICAIEAANLADQKSLKNYPNIAAQSRKYK
jgi:hypothetical protein